jgi:hypothetical protein
MDFDEQRSVALSAPGQSNLTENGIDRAFSSSLEPCVSAPMHAPGRARTHTGAAVMVFGSHCSPRCTQPLTTRYAAQLRSASTCH